MRMGKSQISYKKGHINAFELNMCTHNEKGAQFGFTLRTVQQKENLLLIKYLKKCFKCSISNVWGNEKNEGPKKEYYKIFYKEIYRIDNRVKPICFYMFYFYDKEN